MHWLAQGLRKVKFSYAFQDIFIFPNSASVVESGVAKHTSEDTQDSGVQFIMPAGPRGIVPNKDSDVFEWPSFIRPRPRNPGPPPSPAM